MSKYKYFPDNVEEMNRTEFGYEFWKSIDEYTHGYDVKSEHFQHMFKEISEERAIISKIIAEREDELFRRGIMVN